MFEVKGAGGGGGERLVRISLHNGERKRRGGRMGCTLESCNGA